MCKAELEAKFGRAERERERAEIVDALSIQCVLVDFERLSHGVSIVRSVHLTTDRAVMIPLHRDHPLCTEEVDDLLWLPPIAHIIPEPEEVVDLVDLVLIMSVNPGFGGQKFIDGSLRKIERARAILDRAGSPAHLQVDGGVTSANAGACVGAGADALVAGSFVFKGDYAANIAALKSAPNASTAG